VLVHVYPIRSSFRVKVIGQSQDENVRFLVIDAWVKNNNNNNNNDRLTAFDPGQPG